MTNNEKNIATVLNLSSLSQYFIPFGNFIFPVIIWSSKKNESKFIDDSGKHLINFQLSLLLYTFLLLLISVPIFIYTLFRNLTFQEIENGNFNFDFHDIATSKSVGLIMLAIIAISIFSFIKVTEFILIIYASVKASNGESYKYPLSIPFFK